MHSMRRIPVFVPAMVVVCWTAFCLFATTGQRGQADEKPGHGLAPAATELSYAKHVAPIIQNKCQSCHRPGTAAPFSLSNYDDVVAWSETIKEVVEQKRMPPWHADPRFGKFVNDRRLT